MHTFVVGKDGVMSGRYDGDTKARAVRLVRGHVGDDASEWAAIRAVSGRLRMNAETLRKWIRQDQVDSGRADGVSTDSAGQIRELKRRNAELEQTIDPLRPPDLSTGTCASPPGDPGVSAGWTPTSWLP
jgi:transposase